MSHLARELQIAHLEAAHDGRSYEGEERDEVVGASFGEEHVDDGKARLAE